MKNILILLFVSLSISVLGQTTIGTNQIRDGAVTFPKLGTGVIADAINNGTTNSAPTQNIVFDELALKAPLASPALTGTPTAPTAVAATNTTQLATTAFVQTAIGNAFSEPVPATDQVTNIGTGPKWSFPMPRNRTLTGVRAQLVTAQASGSIFTVDINENGVSILSTKLTIDNTETTSATAATPAVISDTSLADGSMISIDVDQIGNGSAVGLWVIFYYSN